MAQGRSCSLLCNKLRKYWFPPADEDYKDYDSPREPPCYRWTRFISLILIYCAIIYFIVIFIMGFSDPPFIQMSRSEINSIPTPVVILIFNTTIYSNISVSCSYLYPTAVPDTSCSNKILNQSDPSTTSILYVYYDSGVNFTDGTVLTLPVGVYFQISANNSFPNDTLPTLQSYPVIQLMDPDLIFNENKHADSKFTELLSESTNLYVLSPYQRQIIWLDRVKYTDLGGSLKRGALSVARRSSKHVFNYFGLATRIQTFSPLNPLAINPSQFTTTFEVYNQSSTLITYKETSKASQFKVLTFFTSLGGANAFFVTIYLFLYGPANFIYGKLINPRRKQENEESDIEKNSNKAV
ncbi:26334_t:CDS:2 [Racocetra persica]|uniref:26334_t:CDS:1 n=1 Tax=Racocetra persica TaxID=160502 RepID=A0ACA9KX17_9GLOM|nr:26334_t:CDS:2 [Racocetra persica]